MIDERPGIPGNLVDRELDCLAAAAAAGDRSAMDGVLAALAPMIRSIVRARTRDPDDAEQDAAIVVMGCVRTYRPERGAFAAYARAAVFNMAKRYRVMRGPLPARLPEELADRVDAAAAALAGLQAEELLAIAPHREIVEKYFGLGGSEPRSVNQIAASTGRSVPRVRRELAEAVEAMRKAAG